MPSLEILCELVRTAARQALLPRFEQVTAQVKADGSWVTEADLAMQRGVGEALAASWPDIPLLGEEMSLRAQQSLLVRQGTGLWCLDPLDGTSNFAAGIPYFAVSLALLRAGQVVLGLVYDPIRDECFTAERGRGAWLNGVPLAPLGAPAELARAIALVDFKRLPVALAERLVREPPFHSQRNFGSAALDWCQIAAGRGQVYLHGGQKLWDRAAGELILSEVGGGAVTLEGVPVEREGFGTCSVVAAADHRLWRQWRHWLGVPN